MTTATYKRHLWCFLPRVQAFSGELTKWGPNDRDGLGGWGKADGLFRLRIRRLSQLLAVSSQKLRAVAVWRFDAFDLRLVGSDEITTFMSFYVYIWLYMSLCIGIFVQRLLLKFTGPARIVLSEVAASWYVRCYWQKGHLHLVAEDWSRWKDGWHLLCGGWDHRVDSVSKALVSLVVFSGEAPIDGLQDSARG